MTRDILNTIAAISSAVGPAARMIVRASGPEVIDVASALGVDVTALGGNAARRTIAFNDLQVPAWVYLFRGPRSYTGEDLVEFHLPGSPILAKMLLEELLRRGARLAEPGEFTARAYFNGRIGLTAAEGVAATVAANNQQELVAARQLISGELARRVMPIMDDLADVLALVEVGIDFSEEDISFLTTEQVRKRTSAADESLAQLLAESGRFERLAHGPRVVLVGRPNAGKSTLLNVLAGHERAVVSPVAGTTRDALSAEVALKRGNVRVIDVAGIEDDFDNATTTEIDQKMRRRALETIETADVLVLVEEAADSGVPLLLTRQPDLVVRSKSDLLPPGGDDRALRLSAKTGVGIDDFKRILDTLCFGEARATAAALALNVRHVTAVNEARAALHRVRDEIGSAPAEVLALELREALDALAAVVGRVTPDDVLGRIFSGFCIGK
jgi:tRNA modification GTPase